MKWSDLQYCDTWSEKLAAILIFWVLMPVAWLATRPIYLAVRWFYCPFNGHEWRHYGGGFMFDAPKYPVMCKNCQKKDKKWK